MKNNLNDTESRSADMQNLLNTHPRWLILKGNYIISLILFVVLLIAGYFIKYPESIKSNIVINSYNSQTTSIIGQLSVSNANIKKVKIGQKVIIRLNNFPYEEYGILKGEVQNISLIPDDKGHYYISITLPNKLKTSYNKVLILDKELNGRVEIITENLRLIESFFYQIRKL